MNNQIFSRLCNLMQGLGFSVNSGDITTAEMRAYAAGLSMVDELIESAFRNAFIETADEYGVSMLLSLLDLEPAETIEENKQKIIAAICRNFCFLEKGQFIREFMYKGYMVNQAGSKYTFIVDNNGFVKKSFPNLGKLLKNCVPAYERMYRYGRSLDFESMDAFGLNWFEIDNAALPFYAWNTLMNHNYD